MIDYFFSPSYVNVLTNFVFFVVLFLFELIDPHLGQGEEPMDIKFLCLNGTVFDQETRVCERVDEVDCSKSERFYYLNLELYGNTMIPSPDGKKIGYDGFSVVCGYN